MCREFQDAIRVAGLVPPDGITAGKIIPFAGLNKPKANKSARCFLFPDGRGGWFQDFTTGLFEVWQADRDTKYSEAERLAFRERCERDRVERELAVTDKQRVAAIRANSCWRGFESATGLNPYLARKRIQPHGARVGTWRRSVQNGVTGDYEKLAIESSLILPLFDADGNLRSLQAIFPEKQAALGGRDRDFLPYGQKRCCFWWIGKKTPTVLIAEGFATAASLHESTDNQVFIAFDAGNLTNVAQVVRAKKPDAEIIIMGDNDESGIGQKYARAAALACGGKYLIPPTVGHDWNDCVNAGATL